MNITSGKHRSANILICLVVSVLLMGCEEQKEGGVVQGIVTIGGELASSGTVAFHPKNEAASAYGTILSDGTYSLRIGQGSSSNIDYSKIPPGEYTATVSVKGPSAPDEEKGPGAPPKPGAQLSALKFSSKETSGLHFVVKNGLNVINLEVERAVSGETEQQDSSNDFEEQSGNDATVESHKASDPASERNDKLERKDRDTDNEPTEIDKASQPTDSKGGATQ